MPIIESLKETYFSFEDKWYNLVDKISEKAPFFGNIVDSLEDKNIPTFPIAIILVILIILGLFLLVTGGATSTLSVSVLDSDNNPVEGVSVIALSGDTEAASMQTDASGTVALLLANGTYTIKVQNGTYSPVSRQVILVGNASEDFTLTLADATISKAVYLKSASGANATGSGTLIYKCAGTTEELTANYSNGQFIALVKQSCASVEVVSMQNYNLINSTASFAGSSSVTVEGTPQISGSATVTITVEGSSIPPAGLRVKLIPIDNTTPLEEISTLTGIVQFASVPVKKYYVYVYAPDGNYSSYDGSKTGDMKDVTVNANTAFTATLAKTTKTIIKVNVKDVATNNPVSGAEVKLTSLLNENDVRTKISGALGQVSFDVADGTSFVLTVDHPDYIVGETKPANSGDTIDMFLTKVDSANANSLLVSVVDGKKNPISNARVILKKIDPVSPVVGEKTTGAEGTAEFFNLELGQSYMATVSKENFGIVNSPSVQIIPRVQKVLEVVFDIAEGTIALKVMDPEKNPLSGVMVKAINTFTLQQEGASILTTSEGIAEFKIRADKKVYFIIETTNYSKYFTAAYYPTGNARMDRDVIMQRPSGQLVSSIIGIYNGASEVKASADSSSSVGQGTYTVRAIVQVPKGNFSEAGLHLRTGKETQGVANLMEEDGLYISGVKTGGRVIKGTTYTPPQGSDKDLKQLTQGNAKWANITWKNPQEGVYETEADITVTETNPSAPLNFFYRGWVKGTSVIRDPVMSVPASNELYSTAKKRVLLAGAGNLCIASFCKAYTVEAMSGSEVGKKRYLTNTFEAKKDIQYLLTADLTNYSGRAIQGAALTIEGKGVNIDAVMVNGTEQTLGTAMNLGNLGVDAPIQVKILFTTTVSGTEAIKFAINSSTRNELDETITANVKVNKKFTFSVIPKIIIPYITNTLFFEAKDNNEPVSGVRVSVKSGNDTLATVETSGEGIAKYELASPSAGDEITIIAKKEGYDKFEMVIKVDSSLLTITPPSITETIKIGDVTAINQSILVQNNTAKNIKINGTQINGELKNYLDVKFDGTINGTIIEQGKDKNYSLTIKLTSSAMRLKEPKDLVGTIIINTQADGTSQTFTNEIPLNVRISMPGYMDSAKCLKVNPSTIEFITSTEEQTKTITLTNDCTAEQNSIALNKLEAKLSEPSKFGTVSISGTGFTPLTLTEKYAKVAEYLEAGSETSLTIKYTPSIAVASGIQEFMVSIIGKNILEDKTEEKAEAQIKTKVTMNNISKCVVVEKPVGGVLLDMAPWNLGYGNLMASSFGSQMSAYGQNYQGFSNRSAPYGMNGMNMMGMNGYGTGAGAGSQLGTTMNFQQNSFVIKNNCSSDIDIDLDVDSRVSVSEQKLTISKDSDATINVTPGYVLGKYNIKVNAKPTNSEESKKKVGDVPIIIRKLGDLDTDCIKTNVKTISLNSFVYRPQKYTVYNYCYDTGVQLARSNLATIECSAPKSPVGGAQEPYFQQGAEAYYSPAYPLGGQYQNYNNYIQQNGCATNDCSLITGTRVRNRTLDDGGQKGSIEKIDFEIMPSAQYIPQKKLFNSQTGTSGLFQSLGDIRQWATETDARTNVYGNLNVNYTNQYGSSECIEFPITISDIWRIGESIDSAINWGDPNAKPEECQNKDALDIQAYWRSRGSTAGAIPDSAYDNGSGSVYRFIAEPPALKIGPMPTQNSASYPAGSDYYYFQQQQAYARQQQSNSSSTAKAGTATKNCGILDSIEILTQIKPEDAGGALVRVEATSSGSILKNTQGSNLMVEIDRSTMTSDCVKINMPIRGKTSRMISFESQELTWVLRALIIKPGVTISESEIDTRCRVISTDEQSTCNDKLRQLLAAKGFDAKTDAKAVANTVTEFLKTNPTCARFINTQTATDMLTQVVPIANACEKKSNDYGFNLISPITPFKLNSLNSADIVDCSKYFCNGEMLQGYLLNKFSEIKEKVKERGLAGASGSTDPNDMLDKLYKHPRTIESYMLEDCVGEKFSHYKNENGELIVENYSIPDSILTTQMKSTISDLTLKNSGLENMASLLGKIPEQSAVLLQIPANDKYNSLLSTLGAKKYEGDKYYLALNSFKALIEGVKLQENDAVDKAGSCNNASATTCKISYCKKGEINLEQSAFIELANAEIKLVKAIVDKDNMTTEEIAKIYAANPKLKEIHELATFEGLLLTSINDASVAPRTEIFSAPPTAISGLTLAFPTNKTVAQPGKYKVEVNYNYVNNGNEASITLGTEKKAIDGAPNVADNILLKSGFNIITVDTTSVMENTLTGAIMLPAQDGTILFYPRVPVKFTAQVVGYENGINYVLTSPQGKSNLLNWYNSNGILIGPDVWMGESYLIKVPNQPTLQTMKAILYAAQGTRMVFIGGTQGYSVNTTLPTGKEVVNINPVLNTGNLRGNTSYGQIQITDTTPTFQEYTPDKILAQIKSNNACVSDTAINWNEKKFIQENN